MKMIQFKYAIISTAFLLGGMTTGCDTLDIDNLETYDESMVWGDLNLAQAYVNNLDRKSTRLNSSHSQQSRMPSSA